MNAKSSYPPVRKYVLENGLTVLHQNNPSSRAFCAGVWTRTGSRDERPADAGLCHFLEHMVFKGTSRRNAFQISQEIERVGGTLDAFTTKEHMCVYAHVIRSHRGLALDVISDMLRQSRFADDQVALERQVVLEEIDEVNDSPDDLIHDLFAEMVFPDHPLGRPILGFPQTVGGFSRADLKRISRRVFRASNLVLSIYGNMTRAEVLHAADMLFDFPAGEVKLGNGKTSGPPQRKVVKRKLHQQHICVGRRTVGYHQEIRFPMLVLSHLLGGGMSSRLFQRIREEQGLSYSIYTYTDHARDTGMLATYLSVNPKHTRRAIDSVLVEFDKVRSGDVTLSELTDVKEYLKGRILLGLETSTARMMRNARNELYYGRQVTEKELIAEIDGVTLDKLNEAACLALADTSLISLGPSAVGAR